MRLRLAHLFILASAFGMIACADSKEPTPMAETFQEKQELHSLSGTIVYQTFEGGFFSLITNDNQHYTLRHLPAQYRRDGLVVEIRGSINKDMITITQFGDLLEVEGVVVIDESKAKPVTDNPRKVKSL